MLEIHEKNGVKFAKVGIVTKEVFAKMNTKIHLLRNLSCTHPSYSNYFYLFNDFFKEGIILKKDIQTKEELLEMLSACDEMYSYFPESSIEKIINEAGEEEIFLRNPKVKY